MTKCGIYKDPNYDKKAKIRRREEYQEFMEKMKKEKGFCSVCGTTEGRLFLVRKDGMPKVYQSILGFAAMKKHPEDYFFRCCPCNIRHHFKRKGIVTKTSKPRHLMKPRETPVKEILTEKYDGCPMCHSKDRYKIARIDGRPFKMKGKELSNDIRSHPERYGYFCEKHYYIVKLGRVI